MSTGKQLSFKFGEVSPTLRYKSDQPSYAQGLGKLRNMLVLSTGGVTNRPGFEFIKIAGSQRRIPTPGDVPGSAGFTFWSPETKSWTMIEYMDFGYDTGTAIVPNFGFIIGGIGPVFSAFGNPKVGPLPDRIRFTPVKDYVFVTPGMDDGGINESVNVAIETGAAIVESNYAINSALPVGALSLTTYGLPPDMPVSYLMTALLKNGQEKICGMWTSPSAHPHADKSTSLTVTLDTTPGIYADVKSFVLYRAAGDSGPGAFYKLVSRAGYTSSMTTVKFNDFGADDPSITPPVDGGIKGAVLGLIEDAQAGAYYQQRLIIALKAGVTEETKAGDIGVSKIGAPEELNMPIVYNNTGAFKFSIPIDDGSPCNALLAMQRLMAFTQGSAYVIRGGEQGILTPTTVNPLKVSGEGCSNTIEPKMSGSYGYFINNTHTKLMGILFGNDGNLEVYEASENSSHMLNGHRLVMMAALLEGQENTIYILRGDGKLVRGTAHSDAEMGFSIVETDGYIESIFRGKARRPYFPTMVNVDGAEVYYDVLMAYMIRNGVRTLERLNLRMDKKRESEFFADAYAEFGFRLTDNGPKGYAKTQKDYFSWAVGYPVDETKANIEYNGTSWDAGSMIKIRTSASLDDLVDSTGQFTSVFHFFYDDNGAEKWIRYTRSGPPVATGDANWPFEYNGSFNVDVPEVLRDAKSQPITAYEKAKLWTRWLPAWDRLQALYPFVADPFWDPPYRPRLEGPWIAGAENPSAAGSIPVAVFGDGEIMSSPLNPHRPTIELERNISGALSIVFPDFYCWGYVGIPYVSEVETMDLETGGERTLTDSNKVLNSAGISLYETRGGFMGVPGKDLVDMEEMLEMSQDTSVQTPNFTGHKVVHFPTEWTQPGRVNIKHVDPTPLTILSIYPNGLAGD